MTRRARRAVVGQSPMTRGERFNGYTHLAGAIMALAGATVLVVMAALKADPWRIVSFSVYGATLILLYLISTVCLRRRC